LSALHQTWPAPKDELRRTLNLTHPQTTYDQYKGWYGYEPVKEESAAFKQYRVNLAKRTAKTEPYCDNVYDAVYLFAQAIEACITKEVPASGGTLLHELYQARFTGITGPIKLEPNGDRKMSAKLYRMHEDGTSKDIYIYDAVSVSVARSWKNTQQASKHARKQACTQSE
jgi:hypothetical protein